MFKTEFILTISEYFLCSLTLTDEWDNVELRIKFKSFSFKRENVLNSAPATVETWHLKSFVLKFVT
jgi:hypothetical protein